MNKKDLSEIEICDRYITPAIINAGWVQERQIRREYTFTDGRIRLKGKLYSRGKSKRADYVLFYKPNMPIAVIEAKDNNHSVSDGIQQALAYAETLDIPFVFSSNGDAFHEHDNTASEGNIERTIPLNEFPSPGELWNRYKRYKNIHSQETEDIITEEYFFDPKKKIRYYQYIAINRTVEAIANGQNRILLVMATGTGKTLTAFQIIWRLWKSGSKKRILYLADRTALIDQTRRGDFKHFKDKMTVLKKKVVLDNEKEKLVAGKRTIDKADKAYEIFLALYQGLVSYNDIHDAYKEFSRDFFDLIVIDECHRGSAAEDSEWREILRYFDTAAHIGLTATPKETKYVSNIDYFGEPVYMYSLKQGIEDGFLAPYKVIRINIDKDLEWRPEKGLTDTEGFEIEDRIYNVKDYDGKIVLLDRNELVAKRVTEFLRNHNPFAKTIVFCRDIDHAERIREKLSNENVELVKENYKYIMRITGDNDEGRREIDNFINPEEKYPVIATTSKLLTTGIDAQTCELIVLDSNINSLTEFKQIIGRGTRINEEYGKYYFTIMDFRDVTRLFADPEFDGDPVKVIDINPEEPIDPEVVNSIDEGEYDEQDESVDIINEGNFEDYPAEGGPGRKVYVKGVTLTIIHERIQYIGADGKLITESLKDYTKKGLLLKYRSLDDFINKWNKVDKKLTIIKELQDEGILLYELQEVVNKDLDIFDLICHVAFDMPALTRKERANNVKKRNYFAKYGDNARKVLEQLLDKYADIGIENIESTKLLQLSPFSELGTPMEIASFFGGKEGYLKAIHELENELYNIAN